MGMSEFRTRLEGAASYVRDRTGGGFHTALVLGSGLGLIAEDVDEKLTIPYRDIPGFPSTLVAGHRGEIVAGYLGGKRVLVFSGRFHYYQGFSLAQVALPVRVSKRLGASTLIVTNASGGINRSFRPGDIMLIQDHINCMGGNPLMGAEGASFGPVFIDMSAPYDAILRDKAMQVASADRRIGDLKEGVYLATTGPSYETKAEIAFFKKMGADAVGMSTVPEVIVAVQERLSVLGISVITNMACGIADGALSHEEVLDTMGRAGTRVALLVGELLRVL
jgi:purine-nucleoside phosphorylase